MSTINGTKSQENFASVVALLLVKPRTVQELSKITGSHPQTVRGMITSLERESLVEVERHTGGSTEYRSGKPPAMITWIGVDQGAV